MHQRVVAARSGIGQADRRLRCSVGRREQAGTRDILLAQIGHRSRWRINMNFTIELEQEADGRWIAEVPELRGALVYGQTRQEAIAKGQALALRVLAEQLEHSEASSDLVNVTFNAA